MMNVPRRHTEHMHIDTAQFERLRDLLADYGGVYLDSTQHRQLEAAVAERRHATGLDWPRYEQKLLSPLGRQEIQSLIELILNHETYFFRNGPHLRALRTSLLMQLHRHLPPGQPIRLWSAGCSTGEEPYSLAITALETFGNPSLRPVEILASDLSEDALRRARAGIYRGRALQNVTPAMLNRYFQAHEGGYSVGPALRSMVRFQRINLLDPFPTDVKGADAIFCQNVTIYFQAPVRKRLIERFYATLPEGGLLFLGFSETLWNIFDRFESHEVGGAYVYCKGAWPWGTDNQAHAHRKLSRSVQRSSRIRHRGETPSPTLPTLHALRPPVPETQQLFDQGAALLVEGQIEQAAQRFQHLPPNSPLVPKALLLVARAHADRDALDLAIAEARRAIELDPTSDGAYQLMGAIYARQEQYEQAAQQLERARYLNPDDALISYHLAEVYRLGRRPDAAAREYRNVLTKLGPCPPEALLDGVAVGWIRDTCHRYLADIA